MKSYVHKETCTQMFTAAGFTKVQMWKQPKRPWTDGRITEGADPCPGRGSPAKARRCCHVQPRG